MKIAVLVKQVPGTESPLPINSSSTWLDEDSVTYIMNPPDNYALEEALIIREKFGSGEVVVVSMGPERTQKVIREGLAKGADRGIFIKEDESKLFDPLSVAKNLSEAIRDENFDLVFTGLQSDDIGMGQTGVLIGELLGMSTATLAVETELSDKTIKIKRELESGWFQWISLPIPASISIQSGLNVPRYPSLKGIMSAKKKEVKILNIGDFQTYDNYQKIESVFIPQTSKQTEIIEADVDTTVSRIVEILKSDLKVL
tara:strand:+ start:1333 stop:2103 length:771 start_codon:yes stop_codon:yes gene_type:complete